MFEITNYKPVTTCTKSDPLPSLIYFYFFWLGTKKILCNSGAFEPTIDWTHRGRQHDIDRPNRNLIINYILGYGPHWPTGAWLTNGPQENITKKAGLGQALPWPISLDLGNSCSLRLQQIMYLTISSIHSVFAMPSNFWGFCACLHPSYCSVNIILFSFNIGFPHVQLSFLLYWVPIAKSMAFEDKPFFSTSRGMKMRGIWGLHFEEPTSKQIQLPLHLQWDRRVLFFFQLLSPTPKADANKFSLFNYIKIRAWVQYWAQSTFIGHPLKSVYDLC